MKKVVARQLLDNQADVVRLWEEEIKTLNDDYESVITDHSFEQTNQEFVKLIFLSIRNEDLVKHLEEFAEKLIQLGWPLSYITDGLQAFRKISITYVLENSENIDVTQTIEIMDTVDSWIDEVIHDLVEEYSGSWEQIVSLQRVALQELSAPLIPVMENITVMPLIGTIDTSRARLIMENLLTGVIDHSSEVVLIDITGVPVVDTMVAHHIIQAAEAVRLIGSKCILVGIRPEIAQTIVSLGIDLNKFPTQNSLKRGFEEALKLTNREIVTHSTKENALNEMINSINRE